MSAPLGPFETSTDAMLALRPGDGSFTSRDDRLGLLKDTMRGAGVELGAWDDVVLRWLADLDAQTVAAVAGWVGRAYQPGSEAVSVRSLGGIRALLARFDWERDDRQLALEAIERIVTEGGTDGG